MVNPILTRVPTSQVLDYTQQPSIIELEIQVVQCLSIESCLQVTVVVSGRRDIYTHIPSEQILTAEKAPESVMFNTDVPLHLTCMPYQYLHTLWLRGQPTHVAYSDLCSIEAVVLINSLSFDREQF